MEPVYGWVRWQTADWMVMVWRSASSWRTNCRTGRCALWRPGEASPPTTLVVGAAVDDVVGDDQDRVGNSDGPRLADAFSQAPQLRRQVGVLGTGGGPVRLNELAGEPDAAVAGRAEEALAGRFVIFRTQSGARRQGLSGGEHRHVRADLDQRALGYALADPGDVAPPGGDVSAKGDQPLDGGVHAPTASSMWPVRSGSRRSSNG